MKVKLINYDDTCGVPEDIAMGDTYEVVYKNSIGVIVKDDSGTSHQLLNGEYEIIEEEPSKDTCRSSLDTEWYESGDLPAIGTKCYYHSKVRNELIEGIIGHYVDDGIQKLAIIDYDPCGFDIGVVGDFKPIKSEDQEEFEKDLLESVNKNGVDFRHNEWEIAEHMIAQGWRKIK